MAFVAQFSELVCDTGRRIQFGELSDNMRFSPLPAGLIDRLGWTGRVESVQPIAPGFSGARVWRMTLAGLGDVALKRLPAGTDAARVAETHGFVHSLKSAGIKGLPAFHLPAGHPPSTGSVISLGPQLWEASQWQPGQPLSADADRQSIAAGAAAIAGLHRKTLQCKLGTGMRVAPSILERRARLTSIATSMPPISQSATLSAKYCAACGVCDPLVAKRFEVTFGRALAVLNHGWPKVGSGLIEKLDRWRNRSVPCCYVLRDVHRQHVLFDNHDRQICFIDFDAVRLDTPGLDLARWVGSFMTAQRTDPDALWASAMAEYGRVNPFIVERESEWTELVTLLHESGTWGSLANWVEWVMQDRQFDAGIEKVEARIGTITAAATLTIT
jgi:hypothetical protein